MNIGNAIKKIREESGLSRREMSAKIGCTQTALWKIETGKVYPKNSTVDLFCFVTKTPLARLYSMSFEPRDFAPAPSVADVSATLKASGLFSPAEASMIVGRLLDE